MNKIIFKFKDYDYSLFTIKEVYQHIRNYQGAKNKIEQSDPSCSPDTLREIKKSAEYAIKCWKKSYDLKKRDYERITTLSSSDEHQYEYDLLEYFTRQVTSHPIDSVEMSQLLRWMDLPNGIIELLTEMEESIHLLAELGDEKLQFKLGWSYNHGSIGLDRDHKESFKWYEKAAKQGNTAAQFRLGVMYNLGEGVTQDLVKAHMWYYISVNNVETDMTPSYDLDTLDISSDEITDKFSQRMTSAKRLMAQQMANKWVENFERNKKR